jgi:hypothetical protein
MQSISICAVGFGTSVLAGLILAIIGHAVPNLPAPTVAGASQTAAAAGSPA